MTNDDRPIVLDTPGQIGMWHFLSRIHQLALEINSGMSWSRIPMMKTLYLEGFLDRQIRGTKANKIAVLRAMVDVMRELNSEWTPSASVTRALGE